MIGLVFGHHTVKRQIAPAFWGRDSGPLSRFERLTNESLRLCRRMVTCAEHCLTAWRCESSAQPDGGEGLAKRKGVRREAGSEGSVEQSHDLTDRNQI